MTSLALESRYDKIWLYVQKICPDLRGLAWRSHRRMGASSLFVILSKSLCSWHNSCICFFERLLTGIESSVMINASDIRTQIGELVGGKRNFDQFENWLVGQSWNIHKWGDVEAQILAYTVELKIGEYHAAAFSFPELRLELQQIANTFLDPQQSPRTGSSTSLSPVPWPIQPVGKPHVTAFELPTHR